MSDPIAHQVAGEEPVGGSWSTQQLAEFLAFVGTFTDEREATVRAIERAAEVLDAEVVALVRSGSVLAAVGYPVSDLHTADLVAAAEGGRAELDVPGAGRCASMSIPLETDRPLRLVVARSGTAGFDPDEQDLLRGIGRVLAVGLRTLRLLDNERALRERSERQGRENSRLLAALRERQTLLERLTGLQRSIVKRTDLNEVLDAITEGARELLNGDVASIRLVDRDDSSMTSLVSASGAVPELEARWREARLAGGLGERAVIEGRLIHVEPSPERALVEFGAEHVKTAIVAPVHEGGRAVGSLAVGSRDGDRTYGARDEEVLLAFAEHASLALNDAKAVEDAMHEAFHDSLTGLPNRALFLDRLAHALARSARDDAPVAVLFCDLDGFKTVNDSLGHGAGDRLLADVAERLADSLRPADTVARFGGDEFAILLEEIREGGDAARAAQRILDALRAPFELRGREIFVGVSIGIAISTGGERRVEELLRNADLAMYRAKAQGRGRYELFEPQMHTEIVRRMELEVDLKRAIERGQLVLHYQPIFDLPSGEVAGTEALVRWAHPTRGLIRPNDFVPMAEEGGQILALGRWVLHEACRQLALWRAKYPSYRSLFMSVNLSGVQLREAELPSEVESALRGSALDPSHLMLEMTETVLMEDTEHNAARLADLRRLGVRLAIDDFGTGYSSLEYLNRFPIDALKIAKPFVDGLRGLAGADAIPRAIIDLAEIFGLEVIAEGLEHPQQSDDLRALGCRFAQGNMLCEPLLSGQADDVLFGTGLVQRRSGRFTPPARAARADS